MDRYYIGTYIDTYQLFLLWYIYYSEYTIIHRYIVPLVYLIRPKPALNSHVTIFGLPQQLVQNILYAIHCCPLYRIILCTPERDGPAPWRVRPARARAHRPPVRAWSAAVRTTGAARVASACSSPPVCCSNIYIIIIIIPSQTYPPPRLNPRRRP